MHARSLAKSAPLYDYIESSKDFYINKVEQAYRSRINITFRIRDDAELEAKFAQEAQAAGLVGLKGHDWVGGCRITLNSHMPFEGIYTLIDFMQAFKSKN